MEATIKVLLGKTLVSCEGEVRGEQITLTTSDGKKFRLAHSQDCCESVRVEDICGELSDLVGSPITQADEETSDKDPEGYTNHEYVPESMTWTFYRLATAKGQVVIRWLGTSNGYYSERVDFTEL